MRSIIILLVISALSAIYYVAPKTEKPAEVVKNWQATCYNDSGEVYYNKVVKDYWRIGGAIDVRLPNSKRDVISGNCKLEEL